MYALKRCEDVADLKAVSQNLMHSSMMVSNSIYSVLSTDDVGKKIVRISGDGASPADIDEELVVQIVPETMRTLKG
jgi:hypothetical protein